MVEVWLCYLCQCMTLSKASGLEKVFLFPRIQIIIFVPGHSLDFQLDTQSLYTLKLFSANKHRNREPSLWRMQSHVVNPLAFHYEYPHNSPVTLEKHSPSPINSGSEAARVHWGECKYNVSTHVCWLHLQPWPLPTKYMTFQPPRAFFFLARDQPTASCHPQLTLQAFMSAVSHYCLTKPNGYRLGHQVHHS